MERKHTPIPWAYHRTHHCSQDAWYVIVDPSGRGPITDVGGKDLSGQIAEAKFLITDPEVIEANAAFLCRAANNHYQLLNVLKRLARETKSLWEDFGDGSFWDTLADAEKAIADAERE